MARDYGKVRQQFWESDSLRELSVPAKFLALYLLTSPHTNAIGCFRLPIAYICHDTGLAGKSLEAALAELRSVNFAIPCERLPWIYIPNYLRHNPPENPNVWRKCVKELDGLPGEILAASRIAAELYDMAGEERMSKDGNKGRVTEEEKTRLKRFENGIETVGDGLTPLPCPLPEPIPEPCPNQSSAPAIAVVPPKPPAVRATRWPSDQEIPAEWHSRVLAKCSELGRDPPDLRLEAAKFVNYWSSKSGKDAAKLDWEKTFENWCLNARSTDQRSFADRKHAALTAGARGAAFVDDRPGEGLEDTRSNLVRLALPSKP